MPRQKSLVTVIREMVKTEISQAFQSLLGTGSAKKTRTRRRRRRGPGRPPKRRGGRRAAEQ